MENAVLVGLSRQVSLQRELDIIANNLANLNTTGFKRESVLFEEHLASPARVEHFPNAADRRVSFVLDRETRTDFRPGTFQQTGSQFDVAIDGDGFFVVETPAGERFTRNGTLSLNPDGELVTAEGHRVLGEAGPIVLDPADTDISIAHDGTVSTGEEERGRLRVVRFEDDAQLAKQGANLFATDAEALPVDANTRVVQGVIEKSNVNSVLEIGRLIEVTRAYTALANLMNRTDELRRNAIERLAEVPV